MEVQLCTEAFSILPFWQGVSGLAAAGSAASSAAAAAKKAAEAEETQVALRQAADFARQAAAATASFLQTEVGVI